MSATPTTNMKIASIVKPKRTSRSRCRVMNRANRRSRSEPLTSSNFTSGVGPSPRAVSGAGVSDERRPTAPPMTSPIRRAERPRASGTGAASRKRSENIESATFSSPMLVTFSAFVVSAASATSARVLVPIVICARIACCIASCVIRSIASLVAVVARSRLGTTR